jgi:cob(I)alamin adenosyltransferase
MQAEKKMAAKLADFEKSIAEREAKVVAAEAELESLRAKTSDFPAELEKAIKNAEKLVTDNLTRQFDFEKQLSQKHTEGELKLKDQTIQTLNARIKELEQSIKDLNSKVTNADSSVKDIAIKAIESSGKMRILETVGKKEERD